MLDQVERPLQQKLEIKLYNRIYGSKKWDDSGIPQTHCAPCASAFDRALVQLRGDEGLDLEQVS